MAEQKGKDMKLKVLACRQVYSGNNVRGDHYTIFEVEAESPQGQRIEHKLRSFEELPMGQLIDVSVTKFTSERHGESFTLHLKGRNGASSQKQINDLATEVEQLRDAHGKLYTRVVELEKIVQAQMRGQPGAQQPAQQPDSSQLDERYGQTGW